MKLYVSCGDVKDVLEASTEIQACIKAMQRLKAAPRVLQHYFRVSQRGFNEHDDDVFIDTVTVIWFLNQLRGCPDEQV
jgi:hypothetical protein